MRLTVWLTKTHAVENMHTEPVIQAKKDPVVRHPRSHQAARQKRTAHTQVGGDDMLERDNQVIPDPVKHIARIPTAIKEGIRIALIFRYMDLPPETQDG